VATQRYSVVIEQCRKLIGIHQFKNEPQRILLAALASGLRPTDSFIASTLQKHLSREIRVADTAVKNPDSLRWNPLNKRYAAVLPTKTGDGEEAVADEVEDDIQEETSGDKANLPVTPTKNNPINVAVYGQICIAAKSYQSAICTFVIFHC
jgi:general transcription factor 3C polypeptide 3 (transcription factor C subunit 4)